ncbi:MAG: transposase [Blastocatellia bacterium]|nr:transposase [Blastocatellia bacterium]
MACKVGVGPGVEATAATLAGSGRLSHRTIQDLMRDLFGVRMALGTVPALLRRASEAIAPAVDEAREFVRWHEGVKNVDETTWYQRGRMAATRTGAGRSCGSRRRAR